VENRNPFRCFDRSYFAWVAPGMVALFALALTGRAFARGTPARITIGALLAVVMGYLIVVTMARIRRLDEMLLRIQLEAIAISFTLTAVCASAVWYLAISGVRLPDWDLGWWPFMALAWAAAAMVLSRRYR
jgi:hypothetical protein